MCCNGDVVVGGFSPDKMLLGSKGAVEGNEWGRQYSGDDGRCQEMCEFSGFGWHSNLVESKLKVDVLL